jgi:hypothetical protein
MLSVICAARILCCVSLILNVPNKPFMLIVVMLNAVMPSVFMLNAVMPSVVMLNAVMLNAVMPSVVAPFYILCPC